MTTFVRAGEAARRLGVTTPTLYSYVSRGRIRRSVAADGRSSLFDLADIDQLRERTTRPPPPPPTIDVRISTAVTQLNDDGLCYRDVPVESLVDEPFERVAELLWSGQLPGATPHWAVRPSSVNEFAAATTNAPAICSAPEITIMRLIELAASMSVDPTPDGATKVNSATTTDAPGFARDLLASIPGLTFGSAPGSREQRTTTPFPFARRLTSAWHRDPSEQLVRAVNTALVLLADHELATSTLAVRVAASVRASPAAAIIAGLATLEGALHGSASAHVHHLFEAVGAHGARPVILELRERHELVPGFGHKIYRTCDPRFEVLMERVRDLPRDHEVNSRFGTVESLLGVSGALVAQHPNIDLALGALTYVAGLPAGIPLFAVARIAGWTAHYLEELDERPVRFRGLAR
jgi:citrate synthase